MTDPTHNLAAFQAARDWAAEHVHAQPDDRMLEAYGRVLLASLPATTCPCTCHQPGRCPCLPGAPDHRHGAGGYCTVGEPGQHHHVIAFAGDGTWSLTHPATCQPAAVSRVPRDDPAYWDCPVRQLAEKQITPGLAQLVAGGRYACSANDLHDVFQLDDRLHDDQCTPPACAACGCWCHAEERSTSERPCANPEPHDPHEHYGQPAALRQNCPGRFCCCEDPAGRNHGHRFGTGLVCAQRDTQED